MGRSRQAGLVLIVLAAIFPIGLRVATWPTLPHRELDPAMVTSGRELFEHHWVPRDPLAPWGDGLGPVFNSTSCLGCHFQGGSGGAGPLTSNVTTFTIRPLQPGDKHLGGIVHTSATDKDFRETLASVHGQLPPLSQPSLDDLLPAPGCNVTRLPFVPGVHISQRNTPSLYGAGLIDLIPERVIIANERRQRLAAGLAPAEVEHLIVGRACRSADGRVGRFGWKAQVASLAEFVEAACANELGLGNPGQAQPRPLSKSTYRPPGLDLTRGQCAELTAFVASLPRPVERLPDDPAGRAGVLAGKKLFHAIGCADCHTPALGKIEGIYSDLLLHRMGQALVGGGSYDEPAVGSEPGERPHPSEWRTPPLWAVASSAPYMHDGRAATLEEAIRLHGGQAAGSARRFGLLQRDEQEKLIAFLMTLQAP